MSLRELVEQHGFGIKVSAKGNRPFIIVEESLFNSDYYRIEYTDGSGGGRVLKECPSTNDYELIP